MNWNILLYHVEDDNNSLQFVGGCQAVFTVVPMIYAHVCARRSNLRGMKCLYYVLGMVYLYIMHRYPYIKVYNGDIILH